ncbi:MAG: PfkB family carbohydrate kinase, partial [Firmicutes bacterium]|nr:PfkB family carbohydrate kinase [Bacillota bacterium]
LVKPNLTELEQAAGRSLRSREDILAAARALRSRGAACVVVSMGSRGAIAVMEGAVCEAPAMEVKVRTTTGAGDAMVAGLLYGFMRGFSLDAALRCGTAAAAARCVHGGGAFLDWGDYQGLLSRTETLA